MIVVQICDDAIDFRDRSWELLKLMPYDVIDPVEPVRCPSWHDPKNKPFVIVDLKMEKRKERYRK
jgi:hypothetical protein